MDHFSGKCKLSSKCKVHKVSIQTYSKKKSAHFLKKFRLAVCKGRSRDGWWVRKRGEDRLAKPGRFCRAQGA